MPWAWHTLHLHQAGLLQRGALSEEAAGSAWSGSRNEAQGFPIWQLGTFSEQDPHHGVSLQVGQALLFKDARGFLLQCECYC